MGVRAIREAGGATSGRPAVRAAPISWVQPHTRSRRFVWGEPPVGHS